MDNNEQNGFSYTYSAREQEELKRIREKYTPTATTEAEDKMTQLRRMDAGVTKSAQTLAIVLGVLGALILGFGMSLIMTDLATMLGMSGNVYLFVGIVTGLLGGVLVGLAYPVYGAIVKHKRKKIAPEIIRLTDELMK